MRCCMSEYGCWLHSANKNTCFLYSYLLIKVLNFIIFKNNLSSLAKACCSNLTIEYVKKQTK